MFVPDTASFHKVVQIEAGIVRMSVFRRSGCMGPLNPVRVHPYLEGLYVGAHGAVRCASDCVNSHRAQTVEVGSAVSGKGECTLTLVKN